jgi:heterodisulfide reductase subunit A-like polyferredoxin
MSTDYLNSHGYHPALLIDPQTRCTGCGLCEAACHFKAIDSHKHGSDAHAHIDPVNCFGCGLCRTACVAGAISLVERIF